MSGARIGEQKVMSEDVDESPSLNGVLVCFLALLMMVMGESWFIRDSPLESGGCDYNQMRFSRLFTRIKPVMGLKNYVVVEQRKSFLVCGILILICIIGVITRLHSILKFESIIHEFDPWFNYRATKIITENDFYDFINWFDDNAWYPLGRNVGGTVYPGIMVTSSFLHWVAKSLKLPIHIRDICVFLPSIYSGFMSLTVFLLTSEVWTTSAGLFAAFFVSIVPGYVSRSIAGSYDYESISIFILMFTFYLWSKAIKTGSLFWSVLTAFVYFYAVSSWGGYIYVINVIPLHVVLLLISGRYTTKLFCAYTTFFVIGIILSMQIPFVGFLPFRSSEHMPSLLTFLALCGYSLFKHVASTTNSNLAFKFIAFSLSLGVVFSLFIFIVLSYAGVISPWTGRLYSLFDTSYASIHIPIISSVAEHQISSWTRYFLDLHFLPGIFPIGIWVSFNKLSDQMLLIIILGITSAYFSGIMVRLIIVLSPILCIFSSFAMDRLLRSISKSHKSEKTVSNLLCFTALIAVISLFIVHSTWGSLAMYSSNSIILESHSNNGDRNIIDDYREAYYWLNRNTRGGAKVMSWWDYGYQITGFSNKTTLVDNNTWNNTHIAIVGKIMASNESRAYELLVEFDVDYVLVVFGGLIGYDADDIAKFLWMVKISEGEFPNEIHESQYYSSSGVYDIGGGVSRTMRDCLMYKLSYYKFHNKMTNGFDRSRNTIIGHKVDKLDYLEEAFTTTNWIVRIYRVKPSPILNKLTV